jgi:hypothetical protein
MTENTNGRQKKTMIPRTKDVVALLLVAGPSPYRETTSMMMAVGFVLAAFHRLHESHFACGYVV